ncbi:MAG: hypothetical protein D6732_23220 [Methanobacteriota archaeon]|nr:MAG: hypothetical protein D6732_23220 [Euryarchaeota archaeon]
MKYYVYVSDTKLDMLYEQIPPSLKSQIATEIKIDFKIISTSFSDKERQSLGTKYSKLKVLTDYIERHVGVSDVDDEAIGSYFKGTLPMRWGPLMNPYSGERTKIVFFGGHSTHRWVALAGSMKHVVGHVEKEPTEAASATYYILSVILNELRPELGDIYLGSPVFGEDEDNKLALDGVSVALGNLRGPVQKVEFLAKTLLQGNAYSSEPVLLGTPIYVALAE